VFSDKSLARGGWGKGGEKKKVFYFPAKLVVNRNRIPAMEREKALRSPFLEGGAFGAPNEKNP